MSTYKPGRPNKYNPAANTGTKPPAIPGEYRIRDNTGEITYIGETSNLQRRLYQHLHSGKMANGKNAGGTYEWKAADGRSTANTRRIHEREKIRQHNPSMNLSKGGEGRIPAR